MGILQPIVLLDGDQLALLLYVTPNWRYQFFHLPPCWFIFLIFLELYVFIHESTSLIPLFLVEMSNFYCDFSSGLCVFETNYSFPSLCFLNGMVKLWSLLLPGITVIFCTYTFLMIYYCLWATFTSRRFENTSIVKLYAFNWLCFWGFYYR